jgi:hypothetical protein
MVSARRECRRCGHGSDGHEPYIPGGRPGYCAARDEAGTCPCWQWLPVRPWTRLLAWMRRRPAPVRPVVLYPRPVPYPVPGWSEDDDDRTLLGVRVAPYAPRPRGGRRVRR